MNYSYRTAVKLLAITFLAMPVAAIAQVFGYNGDNGPGYWSELDPEWGACAGGADAAQSPININGAKVDRSLKKLDLRTYPTEIDLANNGTNIEQSYEGTGSAIYFKGHYYELEQFHFHTLSEHTIRNQHGVLEMHAVFKEEASDTNLVVSNLYSIGKKPNRFIEKLINAGLPEKNGDVSTSGELINLTDGLSNTRHYYTFGGSLTTPPCTEGVTWIVLKKNNHMTTNQFQSFRTIVANNFRPLQARNGRVVRVTSGRGHDDDDDDDDDDD